MPTVPQPYVYPVANITGAGDGFTGDMSNRLFALIVSQLPGFTNPVINSDETNVTITGDVDLTDVEKALLDGLVNHAADYFIVSLDGETDLGDPVAIEKDAGLMSAVTIYLQMKSGDGNDFAGFGEEIRLTAPLMPINKVRGNFDGAGEFDFTVGASLNLGTVELLVECDGMPARAITVTWK